MEEEKINVVKCVHDGKIALVTLCDDDRTSLYFTCVQSPKLRGAVFLLYDASKPAFYYRTYRFKVPEALWPHWLSLSCVEPCVKDLTFVLCASEEGDSKSCCSHPIPRLLEEEEDTLVTLVAQSPFPHKNENFQAISSFPYSQEKEEDDDDDDKKESGSLEFSTYDVETASVLLFKSPRIRSKYYYDLSFELDRYWIEVSSTQIPQHLRNIIESASQEGRTATNVMRGFLSCSPEDVELERQNLFISFLYLFNSTDARTFRCLDDSDQDIRLIISSSDYFQGKNCSPGVLAALYFGIVEISFSCRGSFLDDVVALVNSKLETPLGKSEKEKLRCIWWCAHFKKGIAAEDLQFFERLFVNQRQLEFVLHEICTVAARNDDLVLRETTSAVGGGTFFQQLLQVYNVEYSPELEQFLKRVCLCFKQEKQSYADALKGMLRGVDDEDDSTSFSFILKQLNCLRDEISPDMFGRVRIQNEKEAVKTPFTVTLFQWYVAAR